MKKPIVRSRLFLLIFSLLLITTTSCNREKRALMNKTVIKVNQRELSAKGFAERLAKVLKPFDALAAKDPQNVTRAKNEVLRGFIIEAITQDWAKSKGLFLKKEEIDAEVKLIRSNYPDDNAFRRALAEEGMTFQDWEDRTQYSLLQKRVVATLSEKTPEPTEKEIADYFEKHKKEFDRAEQVHLRQIVLDSDDNAKNILAELKAGKDMGELAKKFSIAPEANKGGDIGWIDRGTLSIFDKAFNMNKGQRSPILKSPFGYHIYEVLGKRAATRPSIGDAKETIIRQIKEARQQENYAKWLEEQIRKAQVFKNDLAIDNISVETRVH
jgi:peptidyl-prolyl cis-trans isomerase C